MIRAKRFVVPLVMQNSAVGRPERSRQGIIEMHARDRLHASAIAVIEADAIDVLHAADIRVAVSSEWNLEIGGQTTRHARRPQQLVVQMCVGKLVNIADTAQRFPGC